MACDIVSWHGPILNIECRNPGEILPITCHEGRLPTESNGSNPESQRANTYSLSAQALKNRLRLLIKVHNRDGTKIEKGGKQPPIGSDHLCTASRTTHPIQTAAYLFLNGDDRRGQFQSGRCQKPGLSHADHDVETAICDPCRG